MRLKTVMVASGALAMLLGCERKLPGAKADAVLVTLEPNVVSSSEGSLHARATVVDGTTPLEGWSVRILISYTDRNGNARTFAGPTAVTDRTGALEHVFEGLFWEGSGTVTAEVLDEEGQPYVGRAGAAVRGEATFSVLDRTPPTITIEGVGTDNRVGPGLPVDVAVRVADEIGVSQVFFEAFGEANDSASTLIASGATNASVTFSFDVPGGAVAGPTITIYAMAEDLSGNRSAAVPLVLTVDPNVTVAVAPGFVGALLSAGTGEFLADTGALEVSPKTEGGANHVYVTDNVGSAMCGGRCLRKVHPDTGAFVATVPLVDTNAQFTGPVIGIAFDANGDFAYVTEAGGSPDLWRLQFVAGMGYTNLTRCTALGNSLQEPIHLIVDGGTIFVVDRGDDRIKSFPTASCDGATDVTDVTGGIYGGDGWGITRIPASDLLTSEFGRDRIERSVVADGATTAYETLQLDEPLGIDWLAGGATSYADSSFVANRGNRRVVATRGGFTTRAFATFTDGPTDVDFYGASLFVLVGTGGNDRIYEVTGF